ncbi:MAG: hypothetical protein HKN32_05310, partial [Flavobacteriales bacterium]|nr:hypothetical protein [Flavobacteriales bacterium]
GVACKQFCQELRSQGIQYDQMMVTPTPLNSFLWHGIVKTETGYYFGTYSLFDERESIEFYFEPSANNLLSVIEKSEKGKQYLSYTQDFPLIVGDGEDVKIYAVKFGPINYFGAPQFVYPMCLNLNDDSGYQCSIEHTPCPKGPVKDFGQLFRRIAGI